MEPDHGRVKRIGCCAISAMVLGAVLLGSSARAASGGTSSSSSSSSEPATCRVLSTNVTESYRTPDWILCNVTRPTYEIDVYVLAPWQTNNEVQVMCFPTENDQCDQINTALEPACHGYIAPSLDFLNMAYEGADLGCRKQGNAVVYDSTQALDSASALTKDGWILLALIAGTVALVAFIVLMCLVCMKHAPSPFWKRISKRFLRSVNLLPQTHKKLPEHDDLLPTQVPNKKVDEVKFRIGNEDDEKQGNKEEEEGEEEKEKSELLTLNLSLDSASASAASSAPSVEPPSPTLSAAAFASSSSSSSSSSSVTASPLVVKLHM